MQLNDSTSKPAAPLVQILPPQEVKSEQLHPLAFLLIFVALYTVVLAIGWLNATPSQEELYSDSGRFLNEFSLLFSNGKIQWWTSNFMQGHTTAPYFLIFWPLLGAWSFAQVFGEPLGIKMFTMLSIPFAAFSMYLFVKKLMTNSWIAAIAGALFVLNAQILLHIASFEHWVAPFCYALTPLILWSFLKVREEGSIRASALLGLSWAVMMLCYAKLTFMFLPLAGLFFVWLLIDQPERRMILIQGTVIALFLVFLLAGVLLLPLTREYQWMAGFHFDPFIQWQQAFCLKNVISLLDRANVLLAGMPPQFLADRGQFYSGIVLLGAIILLLWRTGRTSPWLLTREGVLLRLFLGMSLVALWLSHGPFSPCTGLLEFLRSASNVPAWLLPLLWLMTLIPLFLISFIIPRGPRHTLWTIIAILVYFFIPGFLLLEKIPLFRDIRAPWGFWEVGFFSIVVAAAIALYHLIISIDHKIYRMLVVLLLALILLGESSVYLAKFFAPGLPEQTFSDFDASQEYLKNSPVEGRVYPLSGRYFYLRTPLQSGRGITSESSWNHFQISGVRALLLGANSSTQTFQTYMRIAGVSHILEDKQDPFTSIEAQNSMAQLYPIGFDSDFIRILENKDSLAPAFLAKDYIAVDPDSASLAPALLNASGIFNVVPVELPSNERNFPYFAGIASPKTGVQVSQQYTSKKGSDFQRIPFASPRTKASEMEFNPPVPLQGWLVVTEAWHPDWVAISEGKHLPIYRAFAGLMAVPLGNVDGPIQFIFSPPFWYNLCVMTAALSWFLILGTFLFFSLPIAPKKWVDYWKNPLLLTKKNN